MARGKQLEVRITGDVSGLSKAFGDAETKAGTFQSKIQSVSSKVGSALKVGAGAGIAGLALMGPELIDLGGKLDTWKLKVDTVFGSSASTIRDWADQNNELFGITDEELAGLAASFGDLIKPMGFTSSEAASMSKDVVGLAGALSEWTGGSRSAAEVSEILAKAMLGERDGLVELGIKISEADVQARLAAKGQDKLTGAALEQAKAIATQELIFQKSTDAQKAYADGGNETIRAGNKLKAIWGEVQVLLATKLVPALAKGVDWFFKAAEAVKPVVEPIVKFIQKNPTPFLVGFATAVGVVAVAMTALAIAENAALLPVYAIIAGIALLAGGLVLAYQKVDWFRSAVDAVASFITDTMIPAVKSLWHWFQDNLLPIIQRVAEFYVNAYKKAFEVAVEVVGWLIEKVSSLYDWFSVNLLPLLKVFAEWVGTTLVDQFGKARDGMQWIVEKAMMIYDWFNTYVLPMLKVVAEWMGTTFRDNLALARDGMKWIIDKAKSLWNWLDKIVSVATDAADALSTIGGGVLSGIGSILPFGGGRAVGGPVMRGSSYLVGERGPELFTPSMSGTIVPNHALASSGGGSVTLAPQITIVESSNPRETARQVVAEIRRMTRADGGRSPIQGDVLLSDLR